MAFILTTAALTNNHSYLFIFQPYARGLFHPFKDGSAQTYKKIFALNEAPASLLLLIIFMSLDETNRQFIYATIASNHSNNNPPVQLTQHVQFL
jgi:hypothetical protein